MEARKRDLTRSFDYWNRAKRLIPNGTQTLSKGPDQFVRVVYPIYLERGRECHVFDVDGNEYIDYPMSLGPVILGHAYPATVEAIKRQLERGITFILMHPLEVELAELICECVPCAEMVRYAKNGSDVIPYLWEIGLRWKEAFNRMARALEVKVECIGHGPRTSFVFQDETGEESLEMRGLFLQETVKRGILFGGPIFMTYSHTQEDIDQTLEACQDALWILGRALEERDILRYMEGEVPQVVFRRTQN